MALPERALFAAWVATGQACYHPSSIGAGVISECEEFAAPTGYTDEAFMEELVDYELRAVVTIASDDFGPKKYHFHGHAAPKWLLVAPGVSWDRVSLWTDCEARYKLDVAWNAQDPSEFDAYLSDEYRGHFGAVSGEPGDTHEVLVHDDGTSTHEVRLHLPMPLESEFRRFDLDATAHVEWVKFHYNQPH